ncbi:glycosyltransferase family 2 protein [Amylibacter sp. IMCC11727]|uniref:glycosyltransferase family 2 protein n=1 Tax=Amylibacter sp. IMCC11727 TaxID=3039851 RepID=UPI00244DD0D3|nr:glycosyltransferase family 2 protein [Amylibacter sp. IMCC11727]WGI20544.1 glycosyltransferase family 2 protein [Amylibacter sp. IMCC11727]
MALHVKNLDFPPPNRPRRGPAQPTLKDILVARGDVSPDDMFKAVALQSFENAKLSDLLQGLGYAKEDVILRAASEQSNLAIVDLAIDPPSRLLSSLVAPSISLRHLFVPWKYIDEVLIIAVSDPEDIPDILQRVNSFAKRFEFVLAPKSEIIRYHQTVHGSALSAAANEYVDETLSCRNWVGKGPRRIGLSLLLICAALLYVAPIPFINIIFGWILIALLANGVFKASMLWARRGIKTTDHKYKRPKKFPKMSILVPLLREEDIVERLIKRMSLLVYPKELLEICLVYEATDTATKQHLAQCKLPYWMKTIEVPENTLQTKPRAMNYALDFCNGDIIGIYDAEDAPEPNQLFRVAQRFETGDENLACVQCQLDYYNSSTNWISRCFTIEYSILFRMILPALERLNLPIPLGGTSVFFRRDILESLGRWDAQNVTEDADLGIRLHRMGYRCAWSDATTYEEANFRVLPWVRQRSRWLKGFLMTWMIHMRHPVQLFKQLGPIGFFVFQVQMLGTVSSFAAVPLVLPMWLFTVGFQLPLYDLINPALFATLIISFVVTELFLLVLSSAAVKSRGDRSLYNYVPMMLLYWPLGAFAAYKAVWELFVHPTYWDKTEHGINDTSYQGEIDRLTSCPEDSENSYVPVPSMTIGG